MSDKVVQQEETKIVNETHTTSFSYHTSSDQPQFTVTASYEFQPNGQAKFGAPITPEQA
jgi:hypothetical protein